IKKIEHFDLTDIPSQVAGIIPRTEDAEPKNGAFNPNLFMEPKEQRKTDIFITYAMAATKEAVEDAGWKPTEQEALDRTGVLIGVGIGGLLTTYDASIT